MIISRPDAQNCHSHKLDYLHVILYIVLVIDLLKPNTSPTSQFLSFVETLVKIVIIAVNSETLINFISATNIDNIIE